MTSPVDTHLVFNFEDAMKTPALLTLLIAVSLTACQTGAQAEYDKSSKYTSKKASDKVKTYLSLDYDSKYIYRGQTAGGEVLQPEAKVKYKGFAASLRGVINLKEYDTFNDKIELAGSYSIKLNKKTKVALGGKIVNEPVKGGMFDFGANSASKYEITSKIAFDTAFSPSVKAFYNPDKEAFTAQARVSERVDISKTTFVSVDVMGGYTDDGKYEFQYGQASGKLNYNLTKKAAVYVGANYAVSNKDSFFDTDGLNDLPPTAGFSDSTAWVTTGIRTYF